MTAFLDYIDRLPLLDLIVGTLAIIFLLAVLAAALTIRRARRTVDRNWVRLEGAGGTFGVVRPSGYIVPNEPKTLEGRVLPTRRFRGDR